MNMLSRPRKRPIKVVEETISNAPHLEHGFIKRSRCQMEDVTENNTSYSTRFNNNKRINYYVKTISKGGEIYKIHTHPKLDLGAMLPSIIDLIEMHQPNIIYITKGKNIEGQVHFKLRSDAHNSFENFRQRVQKTRQKLLDLNTAEKSVAFELQESFAQNAYRVNLINELLNRENGKKYLQKEIPQLITNQYNSEFTSFCLRNRLFNPEEIINYLKYQNLFFDNNKKLELYKLLGIQIRFVPNKERGYAFDSKTTNFIKE